MEKGSALEASKMGEWRLGSSLERKRGLDLSLCGHPERRGLQKGSGHRTWEELGVGTMGISVVLTVHESRAPLLFGATSDKVGRAIRHNCVISTLHSGPGHTAKQELKSSLHPAG